MAVALKDKLRRLRTLPAMPGTVVRLLHALNNGELPIADLERTVRTDQAISAAVLRAANSVLEGAAGRVFTLKESVTRLGMRKLHKIVIAHQSSPVLCNGGRAYGLVAGELWRGAIGGAIAAELIARKTGLLDPAVAFVGGLLRDIGKSAMDLLIAPADVLRATRGRKEGQTQLQLEREVFGTDHAELGGELARLWMLPERLARCIALHHQPPDDEKQTDVLIDIVHCGDLLCVLLGLGAGLDGLAYVLSDGARRRIGLEREHGENYLRDLRVQLDMATAEFEVEPQPAR